MTASTTAQQPIGSGFGAATTAAEVVAGLDLSGRLAIVTGGYVGLGLETVRALTGAGARVIVPARRPDHARSQLAGIDGAQVDELDLADLDSVAAFSGQVLGDGRRVDMVIDNAGIMACPETRVGPGWEAQFATNHLGHFALVNRLVPALAEGARVVSVSSRGHHFSPIRWDDMWFEAGYDKWLAYGQSKTANVLFAAHLNAHGVQAFSLHPGGIWTELGRHLERADLLAMGVIDANGDDGPALSSFKTAEQGAATQTWAATSPQLAGRGGVYLEDCEVAEVAESGEMNVADRRGVRSWAIDPDEAARLWALSAELTGVDALR